MKMNKKGVDEFMVKIMKAVTPIAKKEGVSIDYTGGSYDEEKADVRLTILSAEGREKKRAADFLAVCGSYGISKNALKKKFKFQNQEFIFLGIQTSKRKTPLIAQAVKGGVEYHLEDADIIKQQLNK